jgi:pyridoxal phosphate enzyme (YggS family)
MNIASNLISLTGKLPAGIKLVAVSKTHPVEDIHQAYDAGQRIFGENKALELASKAVQLPSDCVWHFIGHLQTNKVRIVAPYVHTIQSVDSLRLLIEIDKEARRANRVINCLLQFHIATEETKLGMELNEALSLLKSQEHLYMENIRITGVMGMATLTTDENLVQKEFRTLRSYYNQLHELYFAGDASFCEISMGMSGDYLLAIEEGSTMVRIGSAIFGER